MIDGYEKRTEISRQKLLDHIRSNTAVKTQDVTIHMVNDGNSWKMKDPAGELGDVIFGSFSELAAGLEPDTDQGYDTDSESDYNSDEESDYDSEYDSEYYDDMQEFV